MHGSHYQNFSEQTPFPFVVHARHREQTHASEQAAIKNIARLDTLLQRIFC